MSLVSNPSAGSSSNASTSLLKIPAQGSAYPTSLPSLWNYIEPALRHILCAPTNSSGKAPAVDVAYHVGIHTAVYNYFTPHSDSSAAYVANKPNRDFVATGTDFYDLLDRYFADIAKETLLGAPHDDISLIAYYVPCFDRYTAGIKSVDRLLNYVNRHFVKRSVDEDNGWLRLTDVLVAYANGQVTRERLSAILQERKRDELKKWGYEEGGDAEMMAAAEACAEAASPLDRIVPVSSLGLRRWRTEVVEPLLSVPKFKGKRKNRSPATSPNTDKGPKSRLARAVKELLEGPSANEPFSAELAESLAKSLKACGIRMDHPLQRKLAKFVASRNGQ